MEFKLNDNRDLIFSEDANGNKIATLMFTGDNTTTITIRHVQVDPSLRGQGVASKLMDEVVNYARNNNKKINAVCTYAVSWLHKHEEEVSDVLA